MGAPHKGVHYHCKCHANADGHFYNENLDCNNCGLTWWQQRNNSTRCPRYTPKGKAAAAFKTQERFGK